MNIVDGLTYKVNDQPSILTIGVFDGVHRGHQHLIGETVARARELGMQSVVLTFDPHPDLVVRPERNRLYLGTLEQRAELIAALDVDTLIVQPFTKETVAIPARDYMVQICNVLALRELWIGEDFALGRKREGTVARLAELGGELGYTVQPVAPLMVDGVPVSSSRIRLALDNGDVETAAALLGHAFGADGIVVHGDQRGRTIGFPTANIAVPDLQYLPADGVYVCEVVVHGERFGAVTNVGIRPTFNGVQRRVEAHVLDFNGDLYDQTMRVEFLSRLRGEQKFNGIQELIAQITADAAEARAWLVR